MLITRRSSTRGKPNWCAIPRVKLICPLFRSQGRTPQSSRLFNKFTDSFRNLTLTPEGIDRALEAMELITPLSENDIAQRSRQLFHVVIQAPVSRLLPCSAPTGGRDSYRGSRILDTSSPWTTTSAWPPPAAINRASRSGVHCKRSPMPLWLRPGSIKALKRFDPTEPSFVCGIRFVYQEAKPFQLHKAALFFLSLVGDR